jgi:hypothetical protein
MNKNTIIGVVGVLVIIGAIYTFMHKKAAVISEPVQIATSTLPKVTMVSIATSTAYITATGTYPQFPNASASFNESIADKVNRALADHIQFSEENWKARYETSAAGDGITKFPDEANKFPLEVQTAIIRNDADVISGHMRISEYAGGAHGMEAIVTFNYDVKNQKEITIQDFIKKDPKFLNKASVASRSFLRVTLAENANISPDKIDQTMLNAGTEPTIDNFDTFTLPNDHQITFYFTEYQVAAYAYGSSKITLDLPLK